MNDVIVGRHRRTVCTTRPSNLISQSNQSMNKNWQVASLIYCTCTKLNNNGKTLKQKTIGQSRVREGSLKIRIGAETTMNKPSQTWCYYILTEKAIPAMIMCLAWFTTNQRRRWSKTESLTEIDNRYQCSRRVFTARCICIARYYSLVLRCLSVCLSHWCIVSKQQSSSSSN